MAKLFLDSTDDAVVSITNNNYTVFGFAGKTVSVAAGVTGITLKNTVEAVKLSGNVSDYTFLQTGTTVEVRKVGSTTVVTTVSPQADDNGTQFDFGNNGVFNVKNVAGVAGALPTITFGGATISSSAAAAVSGATANTGTVVANALPVVTVPTAAISSIINGSAAAVSGVSFTDTDDNLGFTVTVKATGTSQVSFTDINGANNTAVTKGATGDLLLASVGTNSATITGSKAEVNAVLNTLQYTTNAQEAASETITVTVTDAKGGSTTNTVPVTVSQKLLFTTAATSNVAGTTGADIFGGNYTEFTQMAKTVTGGGGSDTLVLSNGAGGALTLSTGGSITGIPKADLGTFSADSSLTVSATLFGASLTTIDYATVSYDLTGTFNSGTVFNVLGAGVNTVGGDLIVTNLLASGLASTATTDAVTVNLKTTAAATTATTHFTLSTITDTATTIDILNINSNGDVANIIGTVGALATNATINIAGEKALTINAALPSLGTGKVDGSAAKGNLKFTAADTATTITGGSGADSITGGTSADSITGGAGNDTISGGNSTAGDTLSGGDGNDSITGYSGSSDSISGGNGDDTIAGAGGSDTLTGGDGADSITGGDGIDSIVGGAGNDTISAGSGADNITGGAGADSITGGAGVNTYIYAQGDSASTARDTLVDLKESDIIKFDGTALTGLTNGSALGTSAAAGTVYVDATNARLVIGNDQINIPASVANAAFAYSYGTDAIAGTADDYLTVGAAPFASSLNPVTGVLTLTGKAIANVAVVLTDNAPTVFGSAVGTSPARTINASTVTNKGIVVTGSTDADTVTGSAQADTITGGTGADIINVGTGIDTIIQAVLGDSGTFTLNAGATNSISTVGLDVITGLAASDIIKLAAYTGTANATAADAVIDTDEATQLTTGVSGGTLPGANSIGTVRGNYTSSTNVFVGAADGSDLILIYDGNSLVATTALEGIVLVGVGALGITVTAGVGGFLTIA